MTLPPPVDPRVAESADLVADAIRMRDELARTSNEFQKLVDRLERLSLTFTPEGGEYDA